MGNMGERLRELRRRRRLGLNKAAKAIGISSAALSRLEAGYRAGSPESLRKLARFYHLSVDDLLESDSLEKPVPSTPEEEVREAVKTLQSSTTAHMSELQKQYKKMYETLEEIRQYLEGIKTGRIKLPWPPGTEPATPDDGGKVPSKPDRRRPSPVSNHKVSAAKA